jgi:hypothetical protein
MQLGLVCLVKQHIPQWKYSLAGLARDVMMRIVFRYLLSHHLYAALLCISSLHPSLRSSNAFKLPECWLTVSRNGVIDDFCFDIAFYNLHIVFLQSSLFNKCHEKVAFIAHQLLMLKALTRICLTHMILVLTVSLICYIIRVNRLNIVGCKSLSTIIHGHWTVCTTITAITTTTTTFMTYMCNRPSYSSNSIQH